MIVTDMAAVGLSGVFKYGGKFLGYVVAVVLAGGVLVGSGAFLAATGGVNLSDPSIGSVATSRAIAGAVLVALGGLISLSGLFGLAHKLLADAAATAVESATPAPATSTVAEEADEDAEAQEAADGDELVESAEPTVADEGEVPTGHESPPSIGDERPETTDPTATEPAVPESTPGERAESEPASTDSGGQSGPDDYVDQSATDEDWTDSKYATGTQPDDVDGPGATGANDDDETAFNGDETEIEDAGRSEWTPPDPSEFEQSAETADEAAAEPVPGPTDEEAPREGAGDQPEDEVRTWDDVRNASSGDGIEAEKATTDVDQAAAVRDDSTEDERDIADLVGEEDASREPATRDEPNFADDRPVAEEDAEDSIQVEADEHEDADDDDQTLADEGVTSFEVKADDDPLGDRLAGDDN